MADEQRLWRFGEQVSVGGYRADEGQAPAFKKASGAARSVAPCGGRASST